MAKLGRKPWRPNADALQALSEQAREERARELEAATKTARESGDPVLEDLADAVDQMRAYTPGLSFEDDRDRFRQFLADLVELDHLVRAAVRRGHKDNPIISHWLAARVSLGESEQLRRFKRYAIGRTARRPLSNENLLVAVHAEAELATRLRDPSLKLTQQALHHAVVERLRSGNVEPYFGLTTKEREHLADKIEQMSREGWRKKLLKLGLIP